MLGPVRIRHEPANVLADHLVGRVTESPFRTAIKSDDQPSGIDNNNRFVNT